MIASPLAGDDEPDAFSATYSPPGGYIVAANEDGIPKKWDTLTHCPIWERERDRKQVDLSRIASAAFSPDAKSIVFGDSQGAVLVCNVDTGRRDDESLEGRTDPVCCFSFSSDGHYFASGPLDGTIVIWDMVRREARTGLLKRHDERVTAVNFSPSGNNIVSWSLDEIILGWDAFTGEVSCKIKCETRIYWLHTHPIGSSFSRVSGGG